MLWISLMDSGSNDGGQDECICSCVTIVTVVLSVVILHEKMTFVSVTGALLILLGLIVSQKKINQKK